MASSARAKEMMEEETKLDMTPVIDVTFNLLIFFMCTLKFKTLEGKLVSYLPTDKGLSSKKEELQKEDVEIILKVAQDQWERAPKDREITLLRNGSNTPFGKIVRLETDPNNPKNSIMRCEPSDALDAVMKYMSGVKERVPDSKAKINAYARCPHIYVVTVLNMMIAAGFTDISYSGIPNTLVTDLQSGKLK